jgi:hypothetical protein
MFPIDLNSFGKLDFFPQKDWILRKKKSYSIKNCTCIALPFQGMCDSERLLCYPNPEAVSYHN